MTNSAMFVMAKLVIAKLSLCFLLASVVACQSPHGQKISQQTLLQQLYLDQHYPKFKQYHVESIEEVFAINQEIKDLVTGKLLSQRKINYRANKLVEVIFEHTGSELTYDGGANTVAIETFNTRRANCMSLTILAYAMAEEAGIDARFQEVKVPEYWVQNGKYSVLTGHVNLLLIEQQFDDDTLFDRKSVEVDFDPNASKRSFSRKVISKKRMLAMFYNNVGANLLINKNYDHAYAYFKQATIVDPNYDASWGNLGILYRLTKHDEAAMMAYRLAIALDNNNTAALTNLSILLKAHNQFTEANLIDNKLKQKRRKNPYYYMMLADKAMYQKDYQRAVDYYHQSLEINHQYHETYFGLAKAYFELKQYAKARTMMKKALRLNEVNSLSKEYVFKIAQLDKLIAQQALLNAKN